MPEKLKDIFFTDQSLGDFAQAIQAAYPEFDRERFFRLVYDETWAGLELKARMHHVATALHATLPEDYAQALAILKQAAPKVRGFEALVFADYVGSYGLDDWNLSMPALRFFTRFGSAEFAVREFLVRDPGRAMAYLLECADDKDADVRRLASEGCRPRLPWGRALPAFQKDPGPILPVLEKLKDDVSESVRNSVANNLNDISKDHPELVLDICERWYGQNEHTDRVVKHACRTLLKKGNPRAMRLFGLARGSFKLENLRAEPGQVAIGGEVHYTFDVVVEAAEPLKVRLELAVDYVKASGKTSRKVFQIREDTFAPGRHNIRRKFSFADMSTRKHYPGAHRLAVVANGVEGAAAMVHVGRG